MELFIAVLNIVGTISFAISGAIVAMKKHFDFFGVIVLGVTTAVGGGFMRDIIFGQVPPSALVSPTYVIIAIVASVFSFLSFFRKKVVKNIKFFELLMFFMDTFGLAAFTIVGVVFCFKNTQNNLFISLFVGIINGVGGGVLRDIFAGEQPYIFKKHIYACAAAVGAIATFALYNVGYILAVLVGFFTIVTIRCLSAYFRWNLPVVNDL